MSAGLDDVAPSVDRASNEGRVGGLQMAIVLSTQDVHPRERLSYWRETAGAQEVDLSADSGFLATLRNQKLNDVMVCELDCDPCQVKRTARNIARAGCDHFVLCMQLSGRGVASQGDRTAVNANGGFILLDASRPYEMNFEGRSVVLTVPRRPFEERLGAAAALSAITMDAGRPLTGIVSVFLSMLPSRIDAVAKPSASRLADQVLDLIALALRRRMRD